MAGEGFAAIPTWMMRDERFSGNDLLVYAALASRAGYQSIHPGQELIATEARCSVRTVRTALKRLEEFGVLERTTRRYASGAKASDGYVLMSGERPSPIAEQPATVAGCGDLPATSDRTYRQTEDFIPLIEIDRDEIHTGAKNGDLFASEKFAEFWSAYPKKVGKRAAERRFREALKRASHEEIMAGVRRYADAVRAAGTEPRHVKNPEGWLNADRWADEVQAAAPVLSPADRALVAMGSADSFDWSHGAISQ